MDIRTVRIPACVQHCGLYAMTVNLLWLCPECGAPRGETYPGVSYDGSLRLGCDVWKNPCGHIDKYSAVRTEAEMNGLNVGQYSICWDPRKNGISCATEWCCYRDDRYEQSCKATTRKGGPWVVGCRGYAPDPVELKAAVPAPEEVPDES